MQPSRFVRERFHNGMDVCVSFKTKKKILAEGESRGLRLSGKKASGEMCHLCNVNFRISH